MARGAGGGARATARSHQALIEKHQAELAGIPTRENGITAAGERIHD